MPRYLIQKRLIAIGSDYSVRNESGEIVYEIDGKLRFASTFDVKDASGRTLISGREKLMALDATLHLTRGDEPLATLKKVAVNAGRDKFEIDMADGTHMEALGAFYEDDYRLVRGDGVIASVKERLGVRETYDLEVVSDSDTTLALAIAAAIIRLVPKPSTGEP